MLPTFSAYLDLIRLAAAVVVFCAHASAPPISGGLLWQMVGVSQEAVLIFFCLSGFVIGYSVDVAHGGLRSFVINRAARIYSVAIPALILISF